MASSSSYNHNAKQIPNLNVQFVAFPNGFDPNSIPNTTFVQADPSTFRAVVQKLTGTTTTTTTNTDSATQKIPATNSARLAGKPIPGEMGPRKPAFKLHERRQSARKLEIKLGGAASSNSMVSSSTARHHQRNFLGFNGEMLVSPVSPLELFGRGSPRTPRSPMEEEERAIAEKRFYLHPSPLSTPRGAETPELLPLFPVQSPRKNNSFSLF